LYCRTENDVKYGRWENGDLKIALAAGRNSDVGLNAAPHKYSVPIGTVKRYRCEELFCIGKDSSD